MPFVIRTILIYKFGVEYLGLNSLFASILNTLSLANLGFDTAITHSLYKPFAENDKEMICALMNFYRKVFLCIGTGMLVVGTVISAFLPHLVDFSQVPGNLNVYVCYFIFLSDTVISYLLYGYLATVPQAAQRRDIISRVNIVTSMVQCVLQCTMLAVMRNFYFYLVSMPLITALKNFIIAVYVKKQYPFIRPVGDIDKTSKNTIFKKARGIFLHNIVAQTRQGIDGMCISAFIGLATTGIYMNYIHLITALATGTMMVCSSLTPSVGNSVVKESTEKNYRDMKIFDFMYVMFAGFITVNLLCLVQPFISIWIGKSYLIGLPEVIAITFYFYQLRIGDIRWVYHQAVGLWWDTRFLSVAEACGNIVLNILLCKYFGLMGIICATIITHFIFNYLANPFFLFHRYFKNGKVGEFFADHAKYAFTTALACFIAFPLCQKIPLLEYMSCKSVLYFLEKAVIGSGIYVILFFVLWRKTEKYLTAKKWIVEHIGKRF